jgi:hypothetical protein
VRRVISPERNNFFVFQREKRIEASRVCGEASVAAPSFFITTAPFVSVNLNWLGFLIPTMIWANRVGDRSVKSISTRLTFGDPVQAGCESRDVGGLAAAFQPLERDEVSPWHDALVSSR